MTGKEFVRYNESLPVGFMVMDPGGDVLAWIGGLDFNQSPLDHECTTASRLYQTTIVCKGTY